MIAMYFQKYLNDVNYHSMYKTASMKLIWSFIFLVLFYISCYLLWSYCTIVKINKMFIQKVNKSYEKFQSTWKTSKNGDRKFLILLYKKGIDKYVGFTAANKEKLANFRGKVGSKYETNLSAAQSYKAELAALHEQMPRWITRWFRTPWNKYVDTMDVICHYTEKTCFQKNDNYYYFYCIHGERGKILLTQVTHWGKGKKKTRKQILNRIIDYGDFVDDFADRALFYLFLQLLFRNPPRKIAASMKTE
ncbi:hypothetical protein THOM_0969 [Trachipleistophora hominis]|uniref:Uncharacterized protein n=1 Tax=Trachipleistophora hominis TaxID=72359 RepID=L7JXA0_TRAHO|nr:hypothetical protein THOM_0969 [Trachipleistophora hominis]